LLFPYFATSEERIRLPVSSYGAVLFALFQISSFSQKKALLLCKEKLSLFAEHRKSPAANYTDTVCNYCRVRMQVDIGKTQKSLAFQVKEVSIEFPQTLKGNCYFTANYILKC